MDIRLLVFLWIANCFGLSAASDFLQEVNRGFEHGRKISGWDSRASWMRQVKGAKRSPSIRELEKWWKGPYSKQKGNWKPQNDFWVSSPQSESAANGFVPIFPTKGWRSPKKLKPLLSVPHLKFPHVHRGKHLRRRPTKHWTPRKMKQFLPHLKNAAPKYRHQGWDHKLPNKDYVPLMKMKDLMPKPVESWPSINKCWPPTSFTECDPFSNDNPSPGQKDESPDLGQDSEKPISSTFFTAYNEPVNEINNENPETKSWESGISPPLTEGWSSVNSEPGPSQGPPLIDEGSPLSKQIWPSFSYQNDWNPTVIQWTNPPNGNDGAALTQDWAPASAVVSPGIPHVGAHSFSGWRLTDKGWTAPQSYNSWTPISNNGWTPLAEWTPPQNTWIPPSYSAWVPVANDWSPMTQDWPTASPTLHSNLENEPISITSTENPTLGQPVTNSIPFWNAPSSHQWSQMTSNLAKEIKGLINQVTHGIF